MIAIRREQPGDIEAIRAVNTRAFGGQVEARLVDQLRAGCDEVVSLVAGRDDTIIGHILFSPVTLQGKGAPVKGMGLAPMAVVPEEQRRGVGSALVESGLELLRRLSCPFVVVLGHPDYYPRFGFAPASNHGIRCQWQGIPEETFMILVLDESVMRRAAGLARYREEFDQAI